jgi:potassium efflux system protein
VTGLLRALCLLLALLVGGAGAGLVIVPQAVAQAAGQAVDYEAWERTADRAEEAVENNRASTPALEALREDLAEWRDRFLAAQSENASTIATVRQQLAALGDAPEDGTESEDIAAQRQALTARLAELQAPVKRAELAYSRADGLIRGVDRIIRDRQAEELLEFGPSPLNPVHWLPALQAVGTTATQLVGEVRNGWNNPVRQDETRDNLPAVLVFLVLGIVLVVRGRRWSRGLTAWVLGDHPGAGRWLAGFALSLGSLILPFIGVALLIEAVSKTGLLGLRAEQFVEALLPSAFVFLMARWLATRIFPAKEARTLPLVLDDAQRFSGRWTGAALGLVVAAYALVRNTAELSRWSEATTNTLLFPLLVLTGLLVLRLARLLRAHTRNQVELEGSENYRTRLTRFLVLALNLLSLISPVLASVGYFTLAHFLMFPSLASLELLAILLILQRLVTEVYVLVTGNRDGAAESLIPILIGFVLVLMSIPFFALAWGARVADLKEIYSRLLQGFDIGGTQISPAIFLTLVIVFVIGYMATRLLQGTLKNTVLPKTKLDQGGQNAIVSGIGYVGIFLAAIIAITSAGIDLTALGYVAGALSVGIGFGLQNVVSNFVSGIILLIERPISEGDWIEVGGTHGVVRDISVRSTVIETFDRSDVIVPNSDLISGTVTNYTRGNTVGRVIVPVGVAYGTDTRKVEGILKEVAEAHPMVLMSTPPFIVFRGFGADSLDFEIRAILRDVNWVLAVHSDMNHEIARRFTEEGIEIPFAQRDVWLRNPEVLRGETAPETEPGAPSTTGDVEDARAHLTGKDIEDARTGETDGEADGSDGDVDAR